MYLFSACGNLKQEAFAEQTPVLQRDIGSSYEIDELTPPRCQLNHLLGGETCSEESVGAVAVQNSESGDEKSPVMSKDLASCVVEDSEDESEVESNRRTRRHFIPSRPFGFTSFLVRGKAEGFVNMCLLDH